jgi:hypothetical protein
MSAARLNLPRYDIGYGKAHRLVSLVYNECLLHRGEAVTLPNFVRGALGTSVGWLVVEFVARPFRQFYRPDIAHKANARFTPESGHSRNRTISSASIGPFKATHHKSNLFNVAPSWEVDALKLVAEHIRDAILFEQMASRETNPDRKEALQRQAKAHRKLADERAEELGLTPLEPPPLS